MSIISKIIDSINFFKKENKKESLRDDKKDFSILEKYIKNISKIAVLLKDLLLSLNNNLEDSSKKNNGTSYELAIQIKKTKNIKREFEKLFASINKVKAYFHEKRLSEKLKMLNKDYVVIQKIYLFVLNEKDEESLISKLLCIKKEKTLKRKKYILKNQINRLENKLNNLNELIKRIEEIYLDKI
jgi:hypothetical protein